MTVLIMSTEEKSEVAKLYKTRFHTYAELAEHYGVSTTTISTVLKEQGAVKNKPKLTIEQTQILGFLAEHGVDLHILHAVFGPITKLKELHHAN